jgi:hypothetical protein
MPRASANLPLQCFRCFAFLIAAAGRQRRQMSLMDASGFPRTKAKSTRVIRGFQTGDLVRAVVPGTLKRPEPMSGVVAKARWRFNDFLAHGAVDVPARFAASPRK